MYCNNNINNNSKTMDVDNRRTAIVSIAFSTLLYSYNGIPWADRAEREREKVQLNV